MAKKRKTAKKPKRKSRAVKKTKKRLTRASSRKVGLVVKNLVLFVILAVASYLLYNVTTLDTIYNNLFYLLAIILGFVSLAFLIVLLILLVMKGLKK
jgi:preprotein translocase subunit Sec63